MLSFHTDPPSASSSNLVGQERGGVFVMALFMVMILAGALFLVAGNGEAIEHRNNGQGAADSSAYSAAVVNATAMNNLALLNMMKLGAHSTLLYLEATKAGAIAGLAAAGGGCLALQIKACKAIKSLIKIRRDVRKTLARTGPRLRKIIDTADAAQELMMSGAPLYGMVRMERVARSFKGVHGALPTVFSTSLPIDYEDQNRWCLRLSTNVAAMLLVTFGKDPSGAHLIAATTAYGIAWARCDSTPAVRLTDDAQLGGDAFQIQSFVMQGSVPNAADDNIVRATQGGRTVDGGELDRRRKLLSRLHFAQAEYYFDGGGDRGEMLWSMKWKARLARFQFMGGEDSFARLCEIRWPGSPCAEFKAAISEVAPLSLH